MKITFLGTGTSMGVPVAGGFSRNGISTDPRDQRYRCSIWVQTPETSIVVDSGPEFRLQTLRSGITKIDALMITHEHTDHIAGMDDLRPYCYAQNGAIPTYTSNQVVEAIKTRFHYMFEPGKTPGSVDLDFHVIENEIKLSDCTITPLPVKHGTMDILGFRFNDFAYVTDTNFIPEETRELLAGVKVLVLSGLRWNSHPTHFTIGEAAEIAAELGVPKTYLTHLSPQVRHEEAESRLPESVRLAFDQLEINI